MAMTTPSPAFDTGPLSWVIGEVRDALAAAGAALRDAAGRSALAQPTLLLHAKTHLHQAHGALQMVDVHGVDLLTRGAEQALDRFKDGALACTPEHAQPVLEAFEAVAEYLDELLGGSAPQPARLFAYHRALQELLGAERIHPSDLLFADLDALAPPPGETGGPEPDYAVCRASFEKSLLPYLKSGVAHEQRGHAHALRQAIAPLAAAQQDAPARNFWLAMHAFAELVAAGQLEGDLYVKQLFGQINLQVRRLSQGQGVQQQAMLRDALFFIAAAPVPTAAAQQLRQAWRLEGLASPDYAARRYGKIDAAALKAAREALAQLKNNWDRLASEPGEQAAQGLAQALAALPAAGDQLAAPALSQLLREIARAAGDAHAAGLGEQFGLELASAILFAETGLDQVRQLPPDFAEQARVTGARLLALAAGQAAPDAPQWQGELARRLQQGHTIAALAGEIGNGLRQVENLLDAYYEDRSALNALAQAEPLLHQLHGALAILDQDQAMRAALHVQDGVRTLVAGASDGQAEALLDNIARNVGALGFFAGMLAQGGDGAKKRFAFDEGEGLLCELAIGVAPAAVAEPAAAPQASVVELAAQASVVAPAAAPAAPQPEADPGIEAELLEIFIGEAQEVLEFVAATLPDARREPSNQEALTLLRRSFHTLKGSARMVGLDQFGEGAAAVERVMNLWLSEARAASGDLLALLEHARAELADWIDELLFNGGSQRSGAALAAAAARVQDGGPFVAETAQPAGDAVEAASQPGAADPLEAPAATQAAPASSSKCIGTLEIALPLYDIYLAETDALVRLLARDFAQWRDEPERVATPEAFKAAHTLAGTSATVGFHALRDLAFALEAAIGVLAAPGPVLDDAQRALLDEALERARLMLREFADGQLAPEQPELLARLEALRGQLAEQRAASVHGSADELAQRLDSLFAASQPSLSGHGHDAAPAAAPVAAPAAEDAPAAPADPVFAAAQAAAEAALAPEPVLSDELDPDLLPVFLEEATDLLPQIGTGLREWQQNPADGAAAQGLLRTLHTIKGSARMAGAMRLGQHTHELETQIGNMVHAGTSAPAAFDELMASYDQALLLLEQLHQGAAAPASADGEEQAPAPEANGARTPLVRVRADLLDRLVNQAGEVSIARSRLENKVGSLRSAISDFSDNLARLSRQLREVEMQAETQIASRLSVSGERHFDPLEFDRFTRLQELTRMMAESVNDVASFQDSLARTVDSAGDDLAAQSRLTRDLQRDLMRVRMVPFGSLSERLFRVARQTAKETDKRVNLDIRGGGTEIDRGVLEQMAAPFEHLLRNSIVHGIEARARRLAAGKAEIGELLVRVSQQGNEVAIEFSDDGAGLDLARIRATARARGLLAADAEVSDGEAAELIFEPGFSTADALTELAGRGVGMDVVRSEALALGGRVAVVSEPGKGATFTIRLPLTLAVAQVVLVTGGSALQALPATLVERVLQVKEAELALAHEAGTLQVQGQALELHYLPALLGDGAARPAARRSCPVMVIKSGTERIALQVDEVVGNREVVVKNIGPQLARMAGIAGATVLGSGDIVLILNPVELAQNAPRRRIEAASGAAAEPAPAPAARPRIMVVDDSLTVRRVTQRLLEREGFQVMLAKDGVDAVEQMQHALPQLMLVDIEMPRMDGFDLTRQVRGNERTQGIPVIMITSRTADKHRNYALGLGVNAYFGKPFQEPVLMAAIADLLEAERPAA